MNNKKGFIPVVVAIIIAVLAVGFTATAVYYETQKDDEVASTNVVITNFEECIASGNPAMESHPRKCIANGDIFVEIVSNLNLNINSDTTDNTVANTDISIVWQTYTNEEYGFELKYPSDYEVIENENSYHRGIILIKTIKATADNYLGGGQELTISVIDDVNQSDEKYYNWVMSDFTLSPPVGFYNKINKNIGTHLFTVFEVASGIDTVFEYFLKNKELYYSFLSSTGGAGTVDGQNMNEQIISTFKFTN